MQAHTIIPAAMQELAQLAQLLGQSEETGRVVALLEALSTAKQRGGAAAGANVLSAVAGALKLAGSSGQAEVRKAQGLDRSEGTQPSKGNLVLGTLQRQETVHMRPC